jgi:hypothetical protein
MKTATMSLSLWTPRQEAFALQRSLRSQEAHADVYAGGDRTASNGKTRAQAAAFLGTDESDYLRQVVLLTVECSKVQWLKAVRSLS